MEQEIYDEMLSILKELVRVGNFFHSAIEIDEYENPPGDGEEIGRRIQRVLLSIEE